MDLGPVLERDDVDDGDDLMEREKCISKAAWAATRSGGRTHCSGEDTGGPDTADGPPNDESHGIRRCSADDRRDLEEKNAGKQHRLDGEEGVDLAEEKLEGTAGQEIGASIPTNIAE